MAGWKMFDASPFRNPQLGFQPASDPIGTYGTLWMTLPPEGVMPRAVILPVNDGYPWNAYFQPRYVVGPAEPNGWDENDEWHHHRRQGY